MWWTSDNYRNSSFRIYHVDSVYSFSLVWPLSNILKLLLRLRWSLSWQFSIRYITPTLRPLSAFSMTNFERTGGQTVFTLQTHETQRAYKLFGASIVDCMLRTRQLIQYYSYGLALQAANWTLADTSKVHTQSLFNSHMASTCIIWWYLFTLFEPDFGPSLNVS